MKAVLRSKVFKNSAWIFSGNASMAIIGFVTSIIVARRLGPYEFGKLQIGTAYFFILLYFENAINPSLVKKKLIQDSDHAEHVVTQLGRLIFLIAIFTVFIIGILTLIYRDEVLLLVLIMTISMFFRVSNGIVFFNEVKLNSRRTMIAQNIGNIVSSCLKVLFSFLSPMALFQAVFVPVQHFLTAVMMIQNLKKDFKVKFIGKVEYDFVKNFFILSFPLFLAGIIELISNRVGIMVIDSISGKVSVGIFTAATKMAEPWTFVGAAITSSFWPKTVRLKLQSSSDYKSHLQFVFGSLFWISISISLVIFLFSEFIVTTFLSAKYLESIGILKVHIFSLLFLNWVYLTALWEINEGLTKFTLIKNFCALFLNIGLTRILILRYGLVGASYAALISYAFLSTFSCLMNKKSRKLILIQLTSPFAFFKELKKKLI